MITDRNHNTITCSIVILSYNGGDTVKKTLDSVLAQVTIHSYNVLVIDSGSTDGTVEFVKSLPVKLIQIDSSEFGHGSTRNLGARLTESQFVSFLSQDAMPASKDWLDNLLQPFDDPEVVGVYGRQAPDNTHLCEAFFLERTYSRERIRRAHPQPPLALKDIFFSNVNSAIRRDVWERFPFDEEITMSEDQLWGKTVLLDGHAIVYAPEATVYHSHRYSCREVFRRYFESGASLQNVIEGRVGGSWHDGLMYLYDEFRAAGREGLGCLAFALAYEVCRISGFYAGSAEKRLPAWFKRLFLNRFRA